MALYFYRKTKPLLLRPKPTLAAKIFSVVLLLGGLFLIGQVVVPIAGWYILAASTYEKPIVSPIFASSLGTKADDPNTWFVGVKSPDQRQTNIKTYTLTIPKLKIDSATVKIGGDDLKKSLLAWPTSGLPGTYGNAVIFGHSALPQISSPTNYSTIFTFLMDLNEGDDIFIDFDGVRYNYQVIDKKIIEPDDLSVLEQRFDGSYITLITCVPPGTVWKRGVIKAKLVH